VLRWKSAWHVSGNWNEDDFDVLASGEVVGRIFKVPCSSGWLALDMDAYVRLSRGSNADARLCRDPRRRHGTGRTSSKERERADQLVTAQDRMVAELEALHSLLEAAQQAAPPVTSRTWREMTWSERTAVLDVLSIDEDRSGHRWTPQKCILADISAARPQNGIYGIFESGLPVSVRFDAHELHHLAPFFGFVGNELAKVGG
jgi:hypothetical protein